MLQCTLSGKYTGYGGLELGHWPIGARLLSFNRYYLGKLGLLSLLTYLV